MKTTTRRSFRNRWIALALCCTLLLQGVGLIVPMQAFANAKSNLEKQRILERCLQEKKAKKDTRRDCTREAGGHKYNQTLSLQLQQQKKVQVPSKGSTPIRVTGVVPKTGPVVPKTVPVVHKTVPTIVLKTGTVIANNTNHNSGLIDKQRILERCLQEKKSKKDTRRDCTKEAGGHQYNQALSLQLQQQKQSNTVVATSLRTGSPQCFPANPVFDSLPGVRSDVPTCSNNGPVRPAVALTSSQNCASLRTASGGTTAWVQCLKGTMPPIVASGNTKTKVTFLSDTTEGATEGQVEGQVDEETQAAQGAKLANQQAHELCLAKKNAPNATAADKSRNCAKEYGAFDSVLSAELKRMQTAQVEDQESKTESVPQSCVSSVATLFFNGKCYKSYNEIAKLCPNTSYQYADGGIISYPSQLPGYTFDKIKYECKDINEIKKEIDDSCTDGAIVNPKLILALQNKRDIGNIKEPCVAKQAPLFDGRGTLNTLISGITTGVGTALVGLGVAWLTKPAEVAKNKISNQITKESTPPTEPTTPASPPSSETPAEEPLSPPVATPPVTETSPFVPPASDDTTSENTTDESKPTPPTSGSKSESKSTEPSDSGKMKDAYDAEQKVVNLLNDLIPKLITNLRNDRGGLKRTRTFEKNRLLDEIIVDQYRQVFEDTTVEKEKDSSESLGKQYDITGDGKVMEEDYERFKEITTLCSENPELGSCQYFYRL